MSDGIEAHRKLISELTFIYSCSKEEAEERFKDLVVIEYVHTWGGSFHDTKFWMATINYEVEDYHTKETLIKMAEDMGKNWIVLTHHKDKSISIPKYSSNLNKENKL